VHLEYLFGTSRYVHRHRDYCVGRYSTYAAGGHYANLKEDEDGRKVFICKSVFFCFFPSHPESCMTRRLKVLWCCVLLTFRDNSSID
jgi:hypothetical protein